jgi:murein DD-endopeptidase MepM/ murein hydrolase activator NlpD
MLSKSHLKRALAPTLVTGLLTTSALAAASTPAAALDSSPLAAVAPAAAAISSPAGAIVRQSADTDEAAPETRPERVPAQAVVSGVQLKAKPPPWVLPVEGYHLTGEFGDTGLWSSTHTGLDFAADEGAELRAIGPGQVVSTESDGAFGNKTVVKLDDGTVLWYCHQSEFAAEPGQRLAPGELVGYVGSTGNVTGPHLHLEVHRGAEPIDPATWLSEHDLQP